MKKNLTKKLMLSVLTLAFAVVSLGASTFAWFTTMGTADVASFEGKVVSSEGIEIGYSAIGADASEIVWKTGNITADEIADLIKEINGDDWKFNAATPNSLSAAYDFEDINGNKVEGTYVGFSLHFQLSDNTTGKTYPVNMIQLDLQNTTGAKAWNCDTSIVLDESGALATVGTNYTYDVLAATRLAIMSNQTWNGYYAADEDQVAAGSQWTEGFAMYTPAGEADAVPFGALELYNRRMNEDYKAPANELVTFESLPEQTAGALTNKEVIGSLSGDGVLTLNVYLWIEGWDAECLNTLFAQGLSLDLGFELDKENAA